MSSWYVALCIEIEPTRIAEPIREGPPAQAHRTNTKRIESKMSNVSSQCPSMAVEGGSGAYKKGPV